MGKIEDMRRLREAQHGGPARESPPRAGAEAAAHGRPIAEVEGRCSACGKLRPLQNGLVTSHQKGLGKACPGTRKAPA
jgi:hypothetical protein